MAKDTLQFTEEIGTLFSKMLKLAHISAISRNIPANIEIPSPNLCADITNFSANEVKFQIFC